MNLIELLTELKQRQAKLYLDEQGKLNCEAPKGALETRHIELIRSYKQALIDMLTQHITPRK